MKMEKDLETPWNYQLSMKLGKHGAQMLNIRASTWTDFLGALKAVQDDSEKIRDAAHVFDEEDYPGAPTFTQQALPTADVRAVPPEAPMVVPPIPNVEPTKGQQIGPVQVTNIAQQNGVGKTGRPYTRHTITFGGNIKAATFDSLLADVAQHLLGKMALATVEKSRFGYELLNIRPAA